MIKKKLPPHLSLWALLFVSFLIILFLSFGEDLNIGGHTMKKGTFPETLLAANTPLPIVEELPEDSVDVKEEVILQPDTTVKSVLIFGDSMTVLIARRMAAYGAQNGYKVSAITWDGSSTSKWCDSKTLDQFMKEVKPDFIMISLGGNELSGKNFDSRVPYIEKLLKKIDGIPFVWIGPPNWKKDLGYNDMLERTLPKGTFFRSEGIELERSKDHIHPTPKAGGIWTDSIMRWMKTSAHPIPAELPDASIKNPPLNHKYFRASQKVN